MAITRTAMIDDDGSGTTGTIINNAWKTELYNQIDAAAVGGVTAGTWVPTLTGNSGATGQTYASQVGNWTRIGNLFLITGTITVSAKGTLTGAILAIGGLPVPSVGPGAIQIGYFSGFAFPVVFLGAYCAGAMAYLTFTAAAAAGVTVMTPSYATDATTLIFTGSYTV